ncbi:MAG: retropepsin-like domain-containing protein [Acidobacteriota bacterium]|nr:retropepsin-like domain-containing protein [Acidobacteriota bacterium]
MHRLSFAVEHDYSLKEAIVLPVVLRAGEEAVGADAFLDTGSTLSVFRRQLAEMLGLDVEGGEPVRLSTATGGFVAYGHTLTIETLGYSFETTVHFAEHEGFARNVLGRRGWLDQLRIGLVDYEGKLYVSRYDEE